jgi:hypothetical protein
MCATRRRSVGRARLDLDQSPGANQELALVSSSKLAQGAASQRIAHSLRTEGHRRWDTPQQSVMPLLTSHRMRHRVSDKAPSLGSGVRQGRARRVDAKTRSKDLARLSSPNGPAQSLGGRILASAGLRRNKRDGRRFQLGEVGATMREVRRWTLAVAIVMLFTPSHASAAKYDVYSCHGPSGNVVGVDGWSSAVSAGGVLYQACSTVGYFGGGLTLEVAHREDGSARWTFEAPAGTSISDFTLHRAALSVSGNHWVKGYGLFYEEVAYDNSHFVESCYGWWGCHSLGIMSGGDIAANELSRSGLNAHKLIAVAHCVASGTDCGVTPTVRGRFDIYQSRIGLSDPSAPVFLHDPSGPLFSRGPINGIRTASFAGYDRGGGLYRVGVDVDGVVHASQPIEASVTTCTRPVTTPVPCPLAASGTYPFDTSAFRMERTPSA